MQNLSWEIQVTTETPTYSIQGDCNILNYLHSCIIALYLRMTKKNICEKATCVTEPHLPVYIK